MLPLPLLQRRPPPSATLVQTTLPRLRATPPTYRRRAQTMTSSSPFSTLSSAVCQQIHSPRSPGYPPFYRRVAALAGSSTTPYPVRRHLGSHRSRPQNNPRLSELRHIWHFPFRRHHCTIRKSSEGKTRITDSLRHRRRTPRFVSKTCMTG